MNPLQRNPAETTMGKWTHFWDMNSGGGRKEPFKHCFIEAPIEEAKAVFYARFGHNPERVSCTCCGEDYCISEEDSLEQATAFHRGCRYAYFDPNGNEVPEDEAWKPGKGTLPGYSERYVEEGGGKFKHREYQPLDEYLKSDEVAVIRAGEIQDNERTAHVPEQGYVWVD